MSCAGGFWCYFGVALSDFLAFPVLLFYHPRKDGENDTFLVCYDCLFLLCNVGAWHWLESFLLGSVKAVCWQEVRAIRNSSWKCWILNFWISCVLGICHINLDSNAKCSGVSFGDAVPWEEPPPQVMCSVWKKMSSVNQCGPGGDGLLVGPDDLSGLFHALWFCKAVPSLQSSRQAEGSGGHVEHMCGKWPHVGPH